ncbi:MAG: hypothetical protein D4R88_07720 [Methanosarcinales archaeon]|nr:MAG: hypothetical protein D4R88_07720 [Methanosarcinales archaeon]
MTLLLAGTFITASKLLANPEITISVNNGTVDLEKGKKIYFFDDILLVSIGSIFLGSSLMYLLNITFGYESQNNVIRETEKFAEIGLINGSQEKWKNILETLTGDEKEIYQLIYNTKGEILQKDIIVSDFSRAKITRLLDYLEKRGLIERKSYGMTNKVVLK